MTATAQDFLALHHRGEPLVLPNAWDAGSAKVLASLGFEAIATTSSGFAATLGRLDGGVTRDELLAHATRLAHAVDVPVSADMENGFVHDPAGVADTVERAIATGLAGGSIEDFTGAPDDPIYEKSLAVERIAAAAEAAHRGGTRFVLTARCENHLHGRNDLDDTIDRLLAFQEAGADVLFAPGVTAAEDVERLVRAVDRPVNVLAMPGAPTAHELAALGVRRVSVGGALLYNSLGALIEAATELRDEGTYGYWTRAGVGRKAARDVFDA